MYDIYCESRWKITTAVLVIIGLGLYVWTFLQYRDHGVLYGPKQIQPKNISPDQELLALQAPKALNIGGMNTQPMALPANIKESIVSLLVHDPQRNMIVRQGSGVLVSDHGHIITALHLISSLKIINIQNQKHTFKAQVIRRVPEHNLAILKIISTQVFPYSILNIQLPEPGAHSYAVGLSKQLVVSQGNVEKINTSLKIGHQVYTSLIEVNSTHHYIQNGGPLLNPQGEIIGINMFAKSLGKVSQGYAMSANEVKMTFMDIVDFQTLANFKNKKRNNFSINKQKTIAKTADIAVNFPNIRSMDLVNEDYNLWLPMKEVTEKVYQVIMQGHF